MKLEIEPREAIINAINLVTGNPGTSGARTMASVLLHTYNHVKQLLDITELCVLDEKAEEWAWAILKYRMDGKEPQEVVVDADLRLKFDKVIADYWVHEEG